MRIAQLTRCWTFEAAHRIISHPGKCKNLHGHSFHVKVVVEGPVNDDFGMVMDFYQLKVIGDKLFDDLWDHAAILHDQDPLVKVVQDIQSRICLLYGNEPTSENLAFLAARHFKAELPKPVKLVSIEIAETPKCSANVVISANDHLLQLKPL